MNNSNIDNILNNPELGNLFNNVIKSINHNITQNTQNINEDVINSDVEDEDNETESDINEETPINMVLQKLLTDKNGNNIADILSKLSNNIEKLLTK